MAVAVVVSILTAFVGCATQGKVITEKDRTILKVGNGGLPLSND